MFRLGLRPAQASAWLLSGAIFARRPLDRVLQPFTEVRGGEGAPLLLLALNVLLIRAAQYVMRPVRQAPILDQPGGAEIRSHAHAAQAVLLRLLLSLYGALAMRLPRRRLIIGVRYRIATAR